MKVKVTLMSAVEPEIRRATLENNPAFVDLKKKVLELFGENDTELLFHWKDGEEDLITMSSEEEFQEALKNMSDGLLRVFIKRPENCSDPCAEESDDSDIPGIQENQEITQDGSVRPGELDCRFGRAKRRCTALRSPYESREDKGCRRPKFSEKREGRRIRRALRIMESVEQPMQRCRGRRRRWESADDEMRTRRWSDDEHQRHRRCRLMWRDRCRSKMRTQELNTCKLARSMHCRRRASSAPPSRHCSGRYGKCRRTLHGQEQRVKCRRSADDEMRTRRWSDDEHQRHRFRRCRLIRHNRCHSRVRTQELNTCKLARSMHCRRRASSAPPSRHCSGRYGKCKRTLHGQEQRVKCRRSVSLPPQGRSLACFHERRRLRRHGQPKRKLLLKFKLKNAQNHTCSSVDELCNDNDKCLGRRCKSYRRRARMGTNHNSVNADTLETPGKNSESEISDLVQTINLQDDGNDEEIQKNASPDDGDERRKEKCRYRNRDHNETDLEGKVCSGRIERKCRRKYRVQNDGDVAMEFHQNPTLGWEEECEDENNLEEKNHERRRSRKEHGRVHREERFAGQSDEHREGRCWRSLTIKVGMDGKINPRRLARKLSKFFSQNETDLNGCEYDRNVESNPGKCRRSRRRGFEWRYQKMLRRETRGRRRFRASSPDYSRRDVSGFGRRVWRRMECPW